MPINLSFDRFPAEGSAVGRLLAAFGELEVMICYNAKKALNIGDSVLSALYRIRSTRSRLEAADGLMRPVYLANDLEGTYTDAISAVFYCLRIRNQFAHCNWADDPNPFTSAGLFFADLAESAVTPDFEIAWKHVDMPLLQSQLDYFWFALEALHFADHELAVKQGKLERHWWPKPTKLERPPLHNPEGQHIPPWISEEAKARHVARAQAAQAGDPTPTPAHLAMQAERERRQAERAAHRERSLKGHSDPESLKE